MTGSTEAFAGFEDQGIGRVWSSIWRKVNFLLVDVLDLARATNKDPVPETD